MEIDYPVFNISYPNWNKEELLMEFLLFDNIYYSSDEDFFFRYYYKQEFVDTKGDIFKVIGKEDIKYPWYLFFRKRKSRICFEYTKRKTSLEDLKSLFEKRSKSFKSEAAKAELKKMIKNSTSIKELFLGKSKK